MNKNNPLLDMDRLPKFDAILPEHVEPALDSLLARNREQVANLIAEVDKPDWDSFMAPLEQLEDELERAWSPVSHLNAVRDNDDLRAVYERCLPKLSDYGSEMGQNADLFAKVKAISESEAYQSYDPAQRKVIENALRDFHLSGIDLAPEAQQRYREISSELSSLSNEFSRNLLDATDAWQLDVTEPAQVQGIPENALQQAAALATEADFKGWRFSLQAPSFSAVMTYADDASLREQMYRAYVTRASEVGPNGGEWDNSDVMQQILRLRRELARLLGFDSYAEYSLATKMAENCDEVFDFLHQLSEKCHAIGNKEVEALRQYAADELSLDELQPWDYAWASEKLRQHRYDFSQEALRPYFPLPRVLSGLFDIVGRLFGIQVEAATAPSTWHSDVQFFQIRDQAGDIRGQFYLDLYARKQKRGGAWMADCVGRRRTKMGMQLPVAFLTCNFSSPLNDQPALLTHNEVITLFHEFGHGLHHMLTRVEVAGVAGINGVPWDAVELPSQFLENWCWEREALDLISGHIDSGESLPQELLDKMKQGRNFQSAMHLCRQMEFGLFDLHLHASFDPDGSDSIQDLLQRVRSEVAVVQAPSFNRFQHSFSHIFAGGYAAGYYSYIWAEVLSSDAFSLFEENGIFDAATGRRFLTEILERGGSEEPMVLFQAFRGRKPQVDALLRHAGLSQLEKAA